MRMLVGFLVAILCLGVMPVHAQQTVVPGQFPAYRPPRMADGHPDLNGIWQAFVTADWDLQDHEAQPGPHPEIMGAYGGGPAGQSGVKEAKILSNPQR